MGWGTRSGESMVHLQGFMQYDMHYPNPNMHWVMHLISALHVYSESKVIFNDT